MFFRYFASKEDVLFAYSDQQRDRIVDAIRAELPSPSLLRALRAAVVQIADELNDERDLIILRHRIANATASLQGRLTENNHRWEATILELVRPKQKLSAEAELRLRLTVAAAMTALRVATEQWISHGGRGDLTALLSSALDQVGAGVDAPSV